MDSVLPETQTITDMVARGREEERTLTPTPTPGSRGRERSFVAKTLPVRLVKSVPSEAKTALGIRTNPAISKKEKKLSNTKNRSNTKKDWTPPPKFPVGQKSSLTDAWVKKKIHDLPAASQTHLQSTAALFSMVRKNRGNL